MLLKLYALYNTIQALAMAFPAVKTDVGTLWHDVETAIAQKSWSITTLKQIVSDGSQLGQDFLTSWDGSQTQWDAFVAALKGLFA